LKLLRAAGPTIVALAQLLRSRFYFTV